jgi:FAD binding domain
MPDNEHAISGPVHRPGDGGYESARSGFNLAIEHRPELIVEATGVADVAAAVRLAADDGRPVAVMYGLAPLNGSSPHVGAIGYTLGGGVGPLGRHYGYAADHVRWIEVVTADGALRHVAADAEPDLFWALRGAGTNFGVVTEMEVDLFPVERLLGGGLYFGPEACEAVLHGYSDWANDTPEAMASSVLLLAYPDDGAIPAPLRGRHITEVRFAYSGAELADGWRWIEPFRRLGPPVLDTVRIMPRRAARLRRRPGAAAGRPQRGRQPRRAVHPVRRHRGCRRQPRPRRAAGRDAPLEHRHALSQLHGGGRRPDRAGAHRLHAHRLRPAHRAEDEPRPTEQLPGQPQHPTRRRDVLTWPFRSRPRPGRYRIR